ncbi:hypothetical protein SAMN04489864_102315 [Pedobacter insulae]|uniref:Uncharacterized protein n=2 Tax=Pedobacter insulae TaxID=414048 RepID=A0A1I2UYJ8_9SPHI|nr:hypothetical protein SAMN04489864_102315 [Pedobacter insulae]
MLLVVIVCCAFKSDAQHTYNNVNSSQLNKYQDSLLILSEETFAPQEDFSRLEKNAAFIKKFITALKITGSFDYGFDSLKRISILKPSDNSFRIITWFVPLNDGTYRYYGTIQIPTSDGALKLFPLNDATNTINNPNALTTHKEWFGARYYEIIPVSAKGKQPYYVLLGWKGNTLKTSKKVIEVLSFEKNEPVFGKNIFETEKNKPLKNRVIFEYSKQNAMTLIWDKKVNMIVFDHLVPYEPKMTGNFEFYGSDLTFDAYPIVWGKLSLSENVALKNEATANEDLYKAPKKASEVIVNPRQ